MFEVQNLTSVGLDRWFEAGPQPPDRDAALARLRDLMVPDAAKQPFRTVALDAQGRIRAKIGGYITGNARLTFWAVYHRNGEKASTRRELTHLLIRNCIERAQQEPNVCYIETKPAHDTPDQEIFISELRRAGFREIAVSHLYTRDLSGVQEAGGPPLPGLIRQPSYKLPAECLEKLFEASQFGTFDRAQRESPVSAHQTLEELRHWAGPAANTSLWSIAVLGNQPVGLALCGLSSPPSSHPDESKIVELGMIPEARRKRIGTWLVSEMLWEMKRFGAVTVEALIDDENLPSRRLHQKVGFTQEHGDYWTWRRLIRP